MADVTDDQLVERCRSGDDRAFAELVDRHRHLVFGLVARLVPDRDDVEDLAQEVFLRVHRGLAYFRGEASLTTWIYRIVANVCTQARSRRRPSRSIDERDASGRRRHEPVAVDRAFRDVELRDRLTKALARLPDRDRMLLAAHYLRGVQYEALAEALEVPLGTLKTHLHRAKRRLRSLLDEDLHAPR